MPFSEVSLSRKKSAARYKEYGQTDTEDDIQKIPVKRIKIFIQREEKEEVKHKKEYESCEHDHEKERQMRRTVKRSVKLTKYKGYQKEYTFDNFEESSQGQDIVAVDDNSSIIFRIAAHPVS